MHWGAVMGCECRRGLASAASSATRLKCCCHCVQVRQQMHEANGGQGEVFRLSEHMAPPEMLKPKTA